MKRPLIALVISIALFLLSIGLCGMGGINSNVNAEGPLVAAGLVALGLSVVGTIGSVIWLIVAAIRTKPPAR